MSSKSAVWEHSEKNQNNCAKCRNCGVRIKTSSSTTTLKSHLEYKGPKIGCKRPAPQKDTEAVEAKQRSSTSTSSSYAVSHNVSQPLISSTFQNIIAHKKGGNVNHKITQRIIYIIYKDFQLLPVVKRLGFRKKLKTTALLYTMPTYKTIRPAIIDKYDLISHSFKTGLNSADIYCFTADI